uniref:Phosphoglycerate kinase n=1 Tax=Caenorhabditis tropicalis TaxID=1561998 RepID=A0A1I7SYD6_9PELO
MVGRDVTYENGGTQRDAEELVKRGGGDVPEGCYLTGGFDVEALQKVTQPAAPAEKLQMYELEEHPYKPIWKEQRKTDVLAFVSLFSRGRGGMHADVVEVCCMGLIYMRRTGWFIGR